MQDYLTFVFEDIIPALIPGAIVTIQLSLISIISGFFVALLLAIGRVFGPRFIGWIIEGYVSFIRGAPILMLLFFIYYGLPGVGITFHRTTAAFITITMSTIAWQSEYLRGALQSVEGGQLLAAQALGLSKIGSIRHIVLPQALRFALPSWTNEGSWQIKGTSIVFTIGILDLTAVGRILTYRYWRPFDIFIVVGVFYIAMIFVFSRAMLLVQKRYRIPGFEI